MTAIAPEGTPSPEDHAYFLAIEGSFLALRKKAILLSAADWQVARGWHAQGIPVELIQDVMARLFERQVARKGRTISGLRYFKTAVEAAWDEMVALQAGGRPEASEALPVQARLANLAARLPAALPQRARFQEALASLGGPADEVEVALRNLDVELLALLGDALDPVARAGLALQIDQALARLQGRLAAEDLALARARLAEQLLRRRFRVPVMSLFSPEARGEGEEPDSGG